MIKMVALREIAASADKSNGSVLSVSMFVPFGFSEMEALQLPASPLFAISRFKSSLNPPCLISRSSCAALPVGRFVICSTRLRVRSGIRMEANSTEESELKQMRDMAAARKRWETLIREEKVKVLSPREAGYAMQLSGKTVLDVRPSTERQKAWVKGSIWIPIFDIDERFGIEVTSKKISNFVMGGWWSGVPVFSYNNQFISKVEEKLPKDADLIIVCQKGLRSLAACEILYNAGYRNLFWVQGGLEAAEEGDFVREGSQPFKLAGIGGVSEFLGWTDQQRAAAAKEGWSYRLVFTLRLVGLIVLADALYIGAQQFGQYLPRIKSG